MPGYFWDRWQYFVGKLPWVITTTRQTQPRIPPGSLSRVPASAGVMVKSHCYRVAGNTVWSIWHVISHRGVVISIKKVKAKFSHTRYQAFGPELIPVYRQSAHKWLFESSPGDRLPLLSFPAEDHHRLSTSTKLYCLVTEAHRCEQLAQGCYTCLLYTSPSPRD